MESSVILFLFVLILISSALVVTTTSTVYSVLWLVSTFLLVSMFLGFLNLGFPSLLYIIVYVGAIAILFLFVIQLLDLGSVEKDVLKIQELGMLKSSTWFYYIGFVGMVLFWLIIKYLGLEYVSKTISISLTTTTETAISSISTSTILNNLLTSGSIQVKSLAYWFYGPGFLALIIVSIILLIAMIAPISICKDEALD